MRMLGLGAGHQGSACAYDLLQNPAVTEVRLADLNVSHLPDFLAEYSGKRLIPTPLDVRDHAAVLAVIEGLEVRELLVVAQQPRQLALQLRDRHVHAPVPGRTGVPDAGQHIRDGICHAHAFIISLPAGLAHARDFSPEG